jgi:hypothetical protein
LPKKTHPISPLYARFLSPDEKRSIRKVPVENPSSEINLLRVLNAHLMQFQESAPPDLYARVQFLHTCVILNEVLATLVRWQLSQPPGSDFMQDLWDAIREANELDGLPKDL